MQVIVALCMSDHKRLHKPRRKVNLFSRRKMPDEGRMESQFAGE